MNGWINIYKPTGMGSTDVVRKIKHIIPSTKVGHGGTLDPLASGILPIALGIATKTMPVIADSVKYYTFTVQFSQTTDTLDSQGTLQPETGPIPDEKAILDILPEFMGSIMQIPPDYSAVKINGQRAYKLKREGKNFTLTQRLVHIYDIQLLQYFPNGLVDFTVVCGKGMYVRALIRDIAKKLHTYAYLKKLERTRVGVFYKKDSIPLEDFLNTSNTTILPIEYVLSPLHVFNITPRQAEYLQRGQHIVVSLIQTDSIDGWAKSNGKPIALVSYRKGILRPTRVLFV